MAPGLFCTSAFNTMLTSDIYPTMGISALAGVMVVAVFYMISQVFTNPRVSEWSKTELAQIGISAAFIVVTLALMNSFCTFQTGDLFQLTGATSQARPSMPVYNGAEAFLMNASAYSHNAIFAARYYLGAINQMESYSTWKCPIWCFFSIGGSGQSASPQAGGSYAAAGMNILLNSAAMSMFSGLMHVFLLRYVGSGIFLFLFPVALVFRSVPFMRGFGSAIFAVLFGLYIIYPAILGAFYATVAIPAFTPPDEGELASASANWAGGTGYSGYSVTGNDIANTASYAARAFVFAAILPNIALLAAAAAAAYVGRAMGEEIDLSRLTQMV
jgi:hypothetical protein